jgi:AbiV family abortive infection protein
MPQVDERFLLRAAIACSRNAAQLTDDAELLFRNHRFPRASSLAISALEEDGKGTLLLRVSTGEDASDTEALTKRSHDVFQHSAKQSRALESIDTIFGPGSAEAAAGSTSIDRGELKRAREAGLYVDLEPETGAVSMPFEVADAHIAGSYLALAMNLRAARAWMLNTDFETIHDYFKWHRFLLERRVSNDFFEKVLIKRYSYIESGDGPVPRIVLRDE